MTLTHGERSMVDLNRRRRHARMIVGPVTKTPITHTVCKQQTPGQALQSRRPHHQARIIRAHLGQGYLLGTRVLESVPAPMTRTGFENPTTWVKEHMWVSSAE